MSHMYPMAGSAAAEAKLLRDDISALNTENEALKTTVSDLEAARDSYRDEKRALETRCDKMSAEIERLRGVLATEEAERIRCRDGWTNANKQHDVTKRALVDQSKIQHVMGVRLWTLEKALSGLLHASEGDIGRSVAEQAALNALLGKEDK